MKQLFEVNGQFFSTKKAAKEFRDLSQADGKPVRLGPDHWRYGLKGNPRTHSHNNRAGGSGAGFRKRPLK